MYTAGDGEEGVEARDGAADGRCGEGREGISQAQEGCIWGYHQRKWTLTWCKQGLHSSLNVLEFDFVEFVCS